MDKNIAIHSFDNGIRLAVDSMKDVETVSVYVCIAIGSRYENTKQSGISHFLEHMAFKGTEKRNAKQIAEDFESMGAAFNACTGREYTSYYVKVLREDFENAIEIISDIIINSNFPSEEIQREKGVIVQEISSTNDSPDDLIFDKYIEACYPNQAMGRSILGTKDVINSFNRDDFIEYVGRHYVGNNIVIGVAGNIEQNYAIEIVGNRFTGVKAVKIDDSSFFEKALYRPGAYFENKELEQLQLIIGFSGISCKDIREKYLYHMASIILGGGMASRLFQKIREELGLAYSISSFNSFYSDVGLFSIYAGIDPQMIESLLSNVAKEIKQMQFDVSEDELSRAQKQIKVSLLMSQESTFARAEYLACSVIKYGYYIDKSIIMGYVDKIKAVDIMECIKKVFLSSEDSCVMALLGKINANFNYKQYIDFLYD